LTPGPWRWKTHQFNYGDPEYDYLYSISSTASRFWLIAVAFVFGVLRIPASVLALEGVLPADGPSWYVVYQGFLGLLQFAIALLMLVGYRRARTWGRFEALTRGYGISSRGP